MPRVYFFVLVILGLVLLGRRIQHLEISFVHQGRDLLTLATVLGTRAATLMRKNGELAARSRWWAWWSNRLHVQSMKQHVYYAGGPIHAQPTNTHLTLGQQFTIFVVAVRLQGSKRCAGAAFIALVGTLT